MEKNYIYGVTVKSFSTYDKEQIAQQELESFPSLSAEKVLEIVRPEVAKRPKLEKLISNLDNTDYIYMYSIDALLKGKNNNGLEYYKQILEKGINLAIFDFNGGICKLSKFSNVSLNLSQLLTKKNISTDKQVQELAEYIEQRDENTKLGSFKKKPDKISFMFMEIYFAYEGYEITLEKALSLAKEYCDINNKRTFWKAAAEFERSFDYYFWLELHFSKDPDFLRFPKRCGSIPEEYFQIKEYIENLAHTDLGFKEKIHIAANELNMLMYPEIYMRWDLAYQKVPKPRNPIVRTFKTETLDMLREEQEYSKSH